MEPFFIYLAKATGLLLVFFTAYSLLLKKETFFNGNRYFLLAGLATTALLPLAFYTKIVWVNPATSVNNTLNINTLLAMQGVQQTKPAIAGIDIALGIYLLGVILFMARFITDLICISESLSLKADKQGAFRLVDSSSIPSPFSFFNFIAYNSAALQPHELDNIIAHEKVHSRQLHSLDMIAAQLLCIVFWFNPIAWLYKKAISQNLEFIADALASSQVPDKVAYQKTMLKFSVQPQFISITNHFYQSLIKKRIVMLNKKQSQKRSAWKYAVVLPALMVFIFMFQVRVIAQEKEPVAQSGKKNVKISIEITKDTKDKDLNAQKDLLKNQFDTDMTISDVTRNNESEITGIKVDVTANGNNHKVYAVSGDKPIVPITIKAEKDEEGKVNAFLGTSPYKPSGYKIVADTIVVQANNPSVKTITINKSAQTKKDLNTTAITMDSTDALVLLNGKELRKGEEIKLPDGEEVESVNVFKDKETKKKYGRRAKHGVIEITTRKKTASNFITINPDMAYTYTMPEPIEFNFDMQDATPIVIEKMKVFSENFNNDSFKNLDGDIKIIDGLSPEQVERIQDKLEQAKTKMQIHLQNISESARLDTQQYKEAVKSMDAAKKQIDQARKDLERARIDMEKERLKMQSSRRSATRKA